MDCYDLVDLGVVFLENRFVEEESHRASNPQLSEVKEREKILRGGVKTKHLAPQVVKESLPGDETEPKNDEVVCC